MSIEMDTVSHPLQESAGFGFSFHGVDDAVGGPCRLEESEDIGKGIKQHCTWSGPGMCVFKRRQVPVMSTVTTRSCSASCYGAAM